MIASIKESFGYALQLFLMQQKHPDTLRALGRMGMSSHWLSERFPLKDITTPYVTNMLNTTDLTRRDHAILRGGMNVAPLATFTFQKLIDDGRLLERDFSIHLLLHDQIAMQFRTFNQGGMNLATVQLDGQNPVIMYPSGIGFDQIAQANLDPTAGYSAIPIQQEGYMHAAAHFVLKSWGLDLDAIAQVPSDQIILRALQMDFGPRLDVQPLFDPSVK